MTDRSLRDIAITVGQYAIALAALGWLFTQVDVARVLDRLAGLTPPTLVALVAVSSIGLLARFATWYAVIRPIQPISFRSAANTALVVNFVNQLLPSRLSGRVAAPFVLRSETGMAYADAAAVSGLHTAIYALYYGTASLFGLAAMVLFGALSTGLLAVLALSTLLYLAAGAVVLLAGTNLRVLDPLVGGLAALCRRLPRIGDSLAERMRGLLAFTDASTRSFRSLARSRDVWLRYAAAWIVVLLLVPGVRVWLLLTAFDVTVWPIALLPIYLVTAYSVTLLPLTPGGIGITEATATAVFVALGVPASVVVPTVLLDRAFGIYLPALAGWYPSLGLDASALSPEE